jgi:hypothetical protein
VYTCVLSHTFAAHSSLCLSRAACSSCHLSRSHATLHNCLRACMSCVKYVHAQPHFRCEMACQVKFVSGMHASCMLAYADTYIHTYIQATCSKASGRMVGRTVTAYWIDANIYIYTHAHTCIYMPLIHDKACQRFELPRVHFLDSCTNTRT